MQVSSVLDALINPVVFAATIGGFFNLTRLVIERRKPAVDNVEELRFYTKKVLERKGFYFQVNKAFANIGFLVILLFLVEGFYGLDQADQDGFSLWLISPFLVLFFIRLFLAFYYAIRGQWGFKAYDLKVEERE